MRALRQYIFDAGGRSPSSLEGTMLSHPDFASYRQKEWFCALTEYVKAIKSEDGGKNNKGPGAVGSDVGNFDMLTSSLLEDGFAMKILSEMLSWIPKPLNKSSDNLSDFVHFSREEENEHVTIQKKRLHERLVLYGLVPRRDIPGDGNCQMYAVSDQIYGTIDNHAAVRAAAVTWLRNNREQKLDNGAELQHFVHDRPWEEYCAGMQKDKSWGDHLTLMAISEVFGVVLLIISSVEGDNFITEIRPTGKGIGSASPDSTNSKILMLSHYAEFHYGSLMNAPQ